MIHSADTYDQILKSGNAFLQIPFIAIGMILGTRLILARARFWKMPQQHKDWVLLSAVLGAMVGSTLPAFFAGEIIESRAVQYLITPKTMLGGLLGSFFAVALTKKFLKTHEETADSFALGGILALAVGRIGCFFGHCCYGIPFSWGFNFGDGIPRFPTQLLEASLLFLSFAVFYTLEKHQVLKDRLLFLFFSWYGMLRFFLEYLRQPISKTVLGFGFYQCLALSVMGLGVYQLIRRRLAMH
ncbi:hypothetical protein EBR78_03405 [bacterium]|nr:hypothetical protein [bacterium]